MTNNTLVGALFVTVVGGLIVERCKSSVVDPAELGVKTVVVPVSTGALVTNQFYPGDNPGSDEAPEPVAQRAEPQPTPRTSDRHEPTPEPMPAAAAPAFGSIASGTTFRVTAEEPVCTHTHGSGAAFTARVAQYVAGSNGVSVEPGARVGFAVHAGPGNSRGWSIEPRTIELGGEARELHASASHYPMTRVSRRRNQVAGAFVGAVIGGIGAKAAGGSNEEVAAATIVGGGVGTAVASGSQACLNDSGVIDVTLYEPLLLPVR
jgi:hypothetical protein